MNEIYRFLVILLHILGEKSVHVEDPGERTVVLFDLVLIHCFGCDVIVNGPGVRNGLAKLVVRILLIKAVLEPISVLFPCFAPVFKVLIDSSVLEIKLFVAEHACVKVGEELDAT